MNLYVFFMTSLSLFDISYESTFTNGRADPLLISTLILKSKWHFSTVRRSVRQQLDLWRYESGRYSLISLVDFWCPNNDATDNSSDSIRSSLFIDVSTRSENWMTRQISLICIFFSTENFCKYIFHINRWISEQLRYFIFLSPFSYQICVCHDIHCQGYDQIWVLLKNFCHRPHIFE